ncbi:hypothetical protein AHAS_Ahas05G0012100 [Arachis hypogaea]
MHEWRRRLSLFSVLAVAPMAAAFSPPPALSLFLGSPLSLARARWRRRTQRWRRRP